MNIVNLVIVGNIAHDVNTFPKRDNGKDKIVINNGGAGYYSLIPASLYTRVGIVARVGYDFDISRLEDKNIDLTGLKVISNSKTSKFHHTYTSLDGQERTFVPEVYDEAMIKPEDFPKKYFNAKYIHIATNFPKIQRDFIELIRKNSNAIISIDTHEAYMAEEKESIKEIFDMVDIAFIDKQFTNLIDCKAPIKIIKQGKNGCEYRHEKYIFQAPVQEQEVIDKTGAGDVVTGVFLAMMANGKTSQMSLEEAVKVATKSISEYGVDFLRPSDN